jgi:hypothetical protein
VTVALRDRLTADQWDALIRAPVLVSVAVGMASPQGSRQESRASVEGLQRLAMDPPTSGILAEVAAEIRRLLDRHGGDSGDASDALAVDRAAYEGVPPREIVKNAVAAANDALAAIPAADGAGYRVWLYTLAHEVAAAARDGGGFLSTGPRISGGEHDVLDVIESELAVPLPD